MASVASGISEEFTIASFDSSPDRRSSRKSSASSNKVQLSRIQRLVGRDDELKHLQGSLQTVVKDQASGRVFVHGESGSGKTSLVSSFRDDVRMKNEAFFVEGGFDQHTNQPYSAIVDATTQLCNMIAESDQLDEIKSSLNKKSTLDISVLTKLVPAMKAVTDKEETEDQPSRTTGNHAFRMFLDNYKNFFKVVCEIHPVVMFLDDIQWAKEHDRELFLSIALDTKNFLFVAAFRSDELDLKMVSEWFGSQEIKDMQLGALSEAHVNEIVAGLMGMQPEQTTDLSELVWRKTGGNAYFVTEYVEDLHYQNLITYSFMKTHWEWDLQQIEARTDVSDNVVALLSRKLGKMTSDVQQVLMYAACLGQVVDRVVLQQIVLEEKIFESEDAGTQPSVTSHGKNSEQPLANPAEMKQTSRFIKAFKQAIQDGLVEKTIGDGRYKFSHNRVQQAAYEILPQGEEGASLQIRLGDTLLRMSDSGEEWMFFAGVDLLTKFSSQFSTPESRIRLAQLCLEAGKQAEVKSAFIPATGYLKAGIELLDHENRWTDHYDLCLELHVKAAELGRTYGDCNVTLALIDETVREAKCLDDKVRVLKTKAFVLGGLDRLPEAIQACREVLTELNISLPDSPSMPTILTEYGKTKLLLKGRKAKELASTLPPMTDKVQAEAMQFLNAAAIFSWHADFENLTTFIFVKMMRKTLKYGLSKFSPFAFATFGMLLAVLGDIDEAYDFGLTGLDMLKEVEGAGDSYAATYVVVESCIRHLKKPLYDSLSPLLESHEIGMQTGEIEFAALCLSGHGGMSIVLGAQLDNMEEALSNYVPFFRDYSQGMADGLSAPWLQFTMNLQGKAADPLVLTGAGMNEEEFLKHQTEGNHMVAVRNLHLVKMIMLYIFGDLEAADESRAIWEAGSAADGTHFMVYFSMLFSGLTSLGLARKYPKKRKLYKGRAKKHIARLEGLVKAGGVNSMLILKFLCAEKLTLKEGPEKMEEARTAFEDTITLAARTGSRLVRALAYERIGYFLLERRETKDAGEYLQQAFTQYAEYGAIAKVEQMEKNFNLLSFSKPLTAINIRRGGTSAQLQPKTAAIGKHKKLEFGSSDNFISSGPFTRRESNGSINSGLTGGSSQFARTRGSQRGSSVTSESEKRASSLPSGNSGSS